jgi:hypothetical protein
MSTVQKNRIVCGEIADDQTSLFLSSISELVRGVEKGSLSPSGMRRIVATEGYELHVRTYLEKWKKEVEEIKNRPIEWVAAMTTVASRSNLRDCTLESLRISGFSDITLYVDGVYGSIDVPAVYRGANIKTYNHWVLTLTEMFLRNSEADRYVIFQDDFVCCRNLKEYLEKCSYPSDGYLNLFTFMGNETIHRRVGVLKGGKIVKKKEKKIYPTAGWHRSNQLGQGGLALVFNNEAVVDLLSSRHMYERRWDHERRDKFLDGAVVTAMNKAGRYEYVHNPSLIQHMGKKSSMGNDDWGHTDKNPDSLYFPGEDFDALSFLPV